MNIVVTNVELLEQIKQELSLTHDLILQTNTPTKRLTFSHKDTNETVGVLLLEKWTDKALRGKSVHKVYTTPDFYHKNGNLILQLVVCSSMNDGIKAEIILQVG